ncbi:MAG: class A beta-lactamase-related serine hydrolase [Gammaproteobacteria bacterium]|nr:class A beta-lactamase-related serine hydrolase [Gammaproteobacteria bacterium]
MTLRLLRTLNLALACTALWSASTVLAQTLPDEDTVFLSSFEGDNIAPLFPRIDGSYQLPPGPTADQLLWLLDELAVGETTTLVEVQARFSPNFDLPGIVSFINNVLRPDYPNAIITDLISLTPVAATVIIDGDAGPATSGFLQINAGFTGARLINFLQVSNFGGSVQFPDDAVLDLDQAADKFMTLGSTNGVYVGLIDQQQQCQPLLQRNSITALALGSVFKTWILGAVAADVADGLLSRTDPVPLLAAERAAGSSINNEPLGTLFTVQEMATLMMGISDNTATDHLHELVGRELVGSMLSHYDVADVDRLLPFLTISEQFHVFTRFNLPTAQSYVNGTEAFQQAFLASDIIPQGPSFPINFPFFHEPLLTAGTWAASAADICRTLAGLHATVGDNGAFTLVDEAMGAGVAQPNVRNAWDRVWFKGGSLDSGATGRHVLAHAWLLENSGEFGPFVVVALATNPAGGIDSFAIQSVLSRIVELTAAFEP